MTQGVLPMVEAQAKILVVDDEAKNVKLLEAILLPRGYEVVHASNGEEALQQVQQERPDLILLDVMMPVMDGFEACRILKENADTRLIPVVIMTALGQMEDRIKGIEAGAHDFLNTPAQRLLHNAMGENGKPQQGNRSRGRPLPDKADTPRRIAGTHSDVTTSEA